MKNDIAENIRAQVHNGETIINAIDQALPIPYLTSSDELITPYNLLEISGFIPEMVYANCEPLYTSSYLVQHGIAQI